MRFTAALLLSLVCGLQAAPATISGPNRLERDLGQGLTYHRIHELVADLPTRLPSPLQPCVVDVRYVRAEPAAAIAFMAWLKFRAAPRAPVFVLANGETEGILLAALGEPAPGAGLLVVGIAARGFQPGIAVRAGAEEERRAYDAFERGTPVESLLAEKPAKVRHDEASLGKERRGDEEGDPAADPAAAGREPALTDAVLQRAVHLHRALVALKKL